MPLHTDTHKHIPLHTDTYLYTLRHTDTHKHIPLHTDAYLNTQTQALCLDSHCHYTRSHTTRTTYAYSYRMPHIHKHPHTLSLTHTHTHSHAHNSYIQQVGGYTPHRTAVGKLHQPSQDETSQRRTHSGTILFTLLLCFRSLRACVPLRCEVHT